MDLNVLPHAQAWQGRRVLVTGHTGFKGSWLSLWLQALGADLHGLALVPSTTPSLFELARVGAGMHSTIGDIRDFGAVTQAVQACRPEVIFHLAAQPLVRASYADPIATYATNVMGTVHVLEAARRQPGVRAIVNVTTDKCYENREWQWPYREDEPLGGHDPYSSSKACSEIATASWRRSFLHGDGAPAVATARAGNVIGGGDWSDDRLVPDLLRAWDGGGPAVLRNPLAVRPWQHVLDPLAGYLLLAQRLLADGEPWARAWNFGPAEDDARPVGWVADTLAACCRDSAGWVQDPGAHPHEAQLLRLDASLARVRLGWRPRWSLTDALRRVAEWHQGLRDGADVRALSLSQIHDYATDQPTTTQ
ncbi:MAG TPA: CDP-glucose 4,6-dehydratase [Ramlibacter sp.]|jgi:CDP-glucose 4,6-dehydratase|uniref:CDP-glucose 4,6-dehydratase n=1 Tax=Ramlibacter sp. TaxID=1917967 RepID=UPI002D3952C7|nr:CDP-glucose 4,6-dehydratase [Ramlibacter sp.]HZY20344.1 CDP-glucose 4,6-dehydratase [Ramlibacter sp.]